MDLFTIAWTSKVAADLTVLFLKAVNRKVARRFQDGNREAALKAAIGGALDAAISRINVTPDLRDHYLDLFGSFLRREIVVEELSQLLDPSATMRLDLEQLKDEFIRAGLDPDTVPFEEIMAGFVRGFRDTVAQQPEFQGVIEIGLLRLISENTFELKSIAEASLITAIQTTKITQMVERAAQGIGQMVELLNAMQLERSSPAPGKSFDLYQQVAVGLGRAGGAVSFDTSGSIQIDPPEQHATVTLDLSALREFLQDLHNAITHSPKSISPEEREARAQRYRDLIKDLFRNLRLEGLSTGVRPITLPLERVYVQLRAVSEVPDAADVFSPEERRLLRLVEEGRGEEDLREAYLRLDAIRRERWTKDRPERFPIADALRNKESRGLVILGDPGSGKTTLLQFLALVFARGPADVSQQLKLEDSDGDRLPIFAPLAAYDNMLNEAPTLTVREFLGRYYDRRRAAPGLDAVFDHSLDNGSALVLLDGLDEVVDEARRKYVAEQASAFIREATQRGNRVLLTSRIYGYRAAPLSVDLPHVTVLDFRREEIEMFTRQWSRAMAIWDAPAGAMPPAIEIKAQEDERRLLDEIRSNPGVEQLAVNPLLLTMLALLHRQIGGLPQRRIALYDLFIRTLIQTWEENRSRGARLENPKRTDATEAENVLISLSLWLQQNKPSGMTSRSELTTQLARIFVKQAGEDPDSDPPQPVLQNAQRRADNFLTDMRQFSGLLVERGQNAFGFRHLTFQEYFAGRALAIMRPDERWALIQPNLHSNRWREPILLAAARLGVTENRTNDVTDFIKQILDARSDLEDILHRDLFLAVDCAVDDIGVEVPVLRRIVADLTGLITSRVPLIAGRAVDGLSRLGLLRSGDTEKVPEVFDGLIKAIDEIKWDTQAATLRALLGVWQRRTSLSDHLINYVLQGVKGYELDHVLAAPFARCSQELRAALLAEFETLRGFDRLSIAYVLCPIVDTDRNTRDTVFRVFNNDALLRSQAILALKPVASNAYVRAALMSIVATDEHPIARKHAIDVVAPLAARDSEVRDLLTRAVDDSYVSVAVAAIKSLGGAKRDDEIRKMLSKLDHSELRDSAAFALRDVIPIDANIRHHILSMLHTFSPKTQAAALEAIASLLDEDPSVRATITAQLEGKDAFVVSTASAILSRHAASKIDVFPAPRRLLASERSSSVRLKAIDVLATIPSDTSELIVTELFNVACDESADAQASALRALGELENTGTNPEAVFMAALQSRFWQIRLAAIAGLKRSCLATSRCMRQLGRPPTILQCVQPP